jgi:hypothetical protein
MGSSSRRTDAIIAYLVEHNPSSSRTTAISLTSHPGVGERRRPPCGSTPSAVPGGGRNASRLPRTPATRFTSVTPCVEGVLEFFLATDGARASTVGELESHRCRFGRASVPSALVQLAREPGDEEDVRGRPAAPRWSVEGAALPLQGYGTPGFATDSTSADRARCRGRGLTLFPVHPLNPLKRGLV